MISVLVFVLIFQLMADAFPISRELSHVVIDGVEGILIEIPEYEDPALFDYELSAKGVMPIMSLIQLPKSGPKSHAAINKNANTKEKDAMTETVLELTHMIKKLKMPHTNIKTRKGYTDAELSKAIYEIKELNNNLSPDVNVLLKAIKQSLSLPRPFIISGTEKPITPTVINDYMETGISKPEASEDGIPENTDYDSEEFDDK